MSGKTQYKTRLSERVRSQVGDKTLIAAAVAVALIGISFIIATLAPESAIGNFYAGSADIDLTKMSATAPAAGYCAYNARPSDTDTSDYFFTGRPVFSETDCTSDFSWCAYCKVAPTGAQASSENGQSGCNCNVTDIKLSTKLEPFRNEEGRNGYIAELNDGKTAIHDYEIIDLSKQAQALSCSCALFSTDPNVQTPSQTISTGYGSTPLYSAAGVTGVKELVQKWGILLNKMNIIDPVTKQCVALPAGCSVYESYKAGRGENHGNGIAIDIACGEPATPVGQGCTGKTLAALNKIKQYNTGFNIIQECNRLERNIENPDGKNCPGDGTNFQVIHLDIKDRNNPNGQLCLWSNCNWNPSTDCGKATK